ncbi:EAL domain-containing protein [Bradyrhizobium sp. 44]|uniref:EAL domain-containing protein n=1 Tax=Bradyrhizobium sp. 44 TaxID=2782675 RepID=UPI001FFAA983|nr:EAL domain-containing protein [Bradyrhizobium sp. 44]MCK1288962.1 EAL domain-containing protein [Bradyrhizobium sp. 44]
MDLSKVCNLFSVGRLTTAVDRALLVEQFKVLRKQVPVLYAVLLLDSFSVAWVLPENCSLWLRFALPAFLMAICIVRMAQWVRMRAREVSPEEAFRSLSRMRIFAAVLTGGYVCWILALMETVEPALRAPLALLVFMGCIGSSYCLGSFPAASRLTMLIAGAPISGRLLLSGEPLQLCLGLNLALLLVLLARMLNINFRNLAGLIEEQANSAEEGKRARAAEKSAIAEKSKADEFADRFNTALNNMSQGLCFFDGQQRLIVCNRQYLEIYALSPESVRPGMRLEEIVQLRYGVGSAPKMSREEYLSWRTSASVIDETSDTTVELANGQMVRIRHRPMEDNGWVATHEDVTERHRTEEALAAAKGAAERAEAAARAAHAHLKEALDVVPEGLAVFDKEDRLVLWNRQYADFYSATNHALAEGVRFEEILRAGLQRDQYAEARGREDEWLAERLAWHNLPQSSHEQRLPGDRWLRVEERRTADGGSIGVRIDITELKGREASFRLLFEENPIPMWVAEAGSQRLLAANAAMCSHYGYRQDQLLGMTELDLKSGKIGSSDGEQEVAIHNTRAGDQLEVVVERRSLMYEGKAAQVVAAFDVTERNRSQRRIAHLASHDALTELPNRTALDGALMAAMNRAQELDSSVGVLCIDLDRFKDINDLFGHSVGDAVLRETARRLKQTSDGAYVARVGGDEFIAITEQVPLPGAAELLAKKMREAFAVPIETNGHSLELDLCVGIAVFPRDGEDPVSLLANADAALYRAKHDGRGAVRLFTSAMDQQLRQRRAVEHDLRSAVEQGELFLHYQPQVDRLRGIVGHEALVRWQHPTRGVIAPGEFIPIAEESGLIAKIDEWVLREACRTAASWSSPLRIAVNISAAQFRRENLERQVKAALRESGLAPARLELEITEGVLIEDVGRARDTLNRLKLLGVMIALDDFGTGYSSLSYLDAFPLDRIKIDRSFVATLGTSEKSIGIVRAVIGLTHSFGIPVLAEGVETEEQFAMLASMKCDEMQGYLIGRPKRLPLEEDKGHRQTPAHASA